MFNTIQHLWTKQRPAVLAFLAAFCVLVFFAFNALADAIYWMDPRHQDQPLAPWMTPRYVAQSWDLPRDVLNDALLITPGETPRGISLRHLAETHETTLPDLQDRVTAAAEAYRAGGIDD